MPKFIDLTGRKFGKLTVVRKSDIRKNSRIQWECQCECGGTKTIAANSLTSGLTRSCGRLYDRPATEDPRFKDLTGMKFGKLTVLSYSHSDERRTSHWKCLCECGKETIPSGNALKTGFTQSCGCYQRERASEANKTHGESHKGLWFAWRNMRDRCNNPKNTHYKDYGGRGITVCDEWNRSDGFASFFAHMGRPPTKAHTIDRIDVNQGYHPGNVRFATYTEQARNRRNTVRVNYGGHMVCLIELCQTKGLDYFKAYNLLRRFEDFGDSPVDHVIDKM